MQEQKKSTFMAKQNEIQKLVQSELKALGEKYRIKTESMQEQLMIQLQSCENEDQAQEITAEYQKKLQECFSTHSQSVMKALQDCYEQTRQNVISYFKWIKPLFGSAVCQRGVLYFRIKTHLPIECFFKIVYTIFNIK